MGYRLRVYVETFQRNVPVRIRDHNVLQCMQTSRLYWRRLASPHLSRDLTLFRLASNFILLDSGLDSALAYVLDDSSL